MPTTIHQRLDCGIDFAAEAMPDRPSVSFSIRFLSGAVHESPERQGVARLVEQTVSKGTAKHDGRGLGDAFDALGIQRGSGTGRETMAFRCRCLPEFLDQAIDLHAEMFRTPTFPEDACRVAVDLAMQEITALEDEPIDLARKLLTGQAYGPLLGRDPLGTPETLEDMGRDEIEAFWTENLSSGRMQVTSAGALDPQALADKLQETFDGFGLAGCRAPEPVPLEFTPGRNHRHKDLEQDYIVACWPGVSVADPIEPVERVMVAILSGGMSGRLFTEVREKQGLVYWVGAWLVRPRGSGMIHIGASTTPERCEKTYATLFREIDRLAEDLTEDELRRAVTGITARKEREADMTQARSDDLADDLFHFGRPVSVEEKVAKVKAVTVSDIVGYLETHPRDELSVLTLGPKELAK